MGYSQSLQLSIPLPLRVVRNVMPPVASDDTTYVCNAGCIQTSAGVPRTEMQEMDGESVFDDGPDHGESDFSKRRSSSGCWARQEEVTTAS